MAALSVFGLSFGLPAFALVKVRAAGVLRAPGHEDAGARGRRLAGRQHGVQRRCSWRSCTCCGCRRTCSRVRSASRWRRCRACISRWAWPARWRATSTSRCCGAGCGRPASTSAQPGWGAFLLRLVLACAAMTLAVLVGPALGAGFHRWSRWPRGSLWLGLLVCGGGAVYWPGDVRAGLPPRATCASIEHSAADGYTSGFHEQAVP